MFLGVVFFVAVITSSAAIDTQSGNEKSLLAMVLHCSQRWSASQESLCPEACRLWPEFCYYAVAAELGVPGTCKLPPYPRVGSYSIDNIARADAALADFSLFYSCPQDYILLGQQPHCRGGVWTAAFPSCQSETKCQLKEVPGITYNCIDYATGKCPEWIGGGQRVQPECRSNYKQEQLGLMHCVNGSWNFIPTCQRRGIIGCGRMSETQSASLPWHAIVYNYYYSKEPLYQHLFCGGSIVSTKIVISAAHCFWDDAAGASIPAAYFTVAVGATGHDWDGYGDNRQTSNVSDVKIPPRFRGDLTHLQDDISVVFLATPFVFNFYVRPVCLDFSVPAEEKELTHGSVGKIAGWSGTPILRAIELSYVNIERCYSDLPRTHHGYITSDKICAESNNGTLCSGDSGGGLAFPAEKRGDGTRSWYLRGVASWTPRADTGGGCAVYAVFTQVLKHAAFITSLIQAGDESSSEYEIDGSEL